jgi:hypothetical protein
VKLYLQLVEIANVMLEKAFLDLPLKFPGGVMEDVALVVIRREDREPIQRYVGCFDLVFYGI